MKLYHLRHGMAAEKNDREYPDDSQRPLTPGGKREMRTIARGMLHLKFRIDRILSSPYLRARQTAEIVSQEMKLPLKVEFSDHLVPGASFRELLAELHASEKEFSRVLLVGHEPFLSQSLSLILSGTAHAFLPMKKGGICKVSIDRWNEIPCATLKWFLTPKQLMALAPH